MDNGIAYGLHRDGQYFVKKEILTSNHGGTRRWTRAEGTRVGQVEKVLAFPSQVENTQMLMCRTESFADDLRTGQGVVGGRAASSLRSAKTSP